MAKPISFRWDEGFIARIDEARGLIPRSAFVRQAIERQIATSDIRAGIDAVASQPLGLPVQEFVVPPEYVEGVERTLKPASRLGKGYVAPIPKQPKQ